MSTARMERTGSASLVPFVADSYVGYVDITTNKIYSQSYEDRAAADEMAG